jgi:pyruvate dehydrogenase E1 component beta subunit
MKGDVPEEEFTIPLGKGEIKRQGKDITVVATGHLVNEAIKVSDKLLEKQISIEVYDPRTLLPMDKRLLKDSIVKTGRVIIFDDSNRTCGFAAEVSAFIADECFTSLSEPVKRITRADVPIPFSQKMEQYVLPDEEKLTNTILEMIDY